jgi:hypothetical protein
MIDLDQLEEQAVVAGGLPVVGLSSEITASPVETTPPTSQPEGRPTSPRLTENNQTVAFGQLSFSWEQESAESQAEPANSTPKVCVTSDPCPSESTDKLPTIWCNPLALREIANSDFKRESAQLAEAHEVAPQIRPSDLVPSFGDACDAQVHCDPSNTATTPSKNPHDCAGDAPAVSEESDRITCTDTGFDPGFHGGLEESVDGDTVSPGVQPRDCNTVGVSRDDSSDLSSIAASAEADEKGAPSDPDATAEGNLTDPASPESGNSALLEDGAGAGREQVCGDISDDRPQTAEAISKVGGLEQGGESQQTGQTASISGQCADAPTPATSMTSRKSRQSHPKVVVKERDYLSESERKILDRLNALRIDQHNVPQSYPTDEVEAGYGDLLTCTKTAYRNISKLVEKGFIEVVKKGNEIRPGSGARYRILSEDEAKKRRLDKGLTHYVENGLARKAVREPEEIDEQED